MSLHIYRYANKTDWMDVPEDVGRVLTNCCHCYMPAKDAKYRKHFDDWNARQEVACREGKGCDANPRRRIGMYNRPHPEYD